MKNKSLFTEAVDDTPRLRIIEFFIESRELDHAKQDVIDDTGLSRSTVFEAWKPLEKKRIIVQTRKVGKTKLYALNMKNPVSMKLLEIFDILVRKELMRRGR